MKNLVSIILISLIGFSCQKEIDVDLNETNPVIVLEGSYSSEDSLVTLKVSLTSSYFDANPSPSIDNLSPAIIDGNGVSTPLVSLGDGLYILSNYVPNYNSIYTLSVDYNGQIFSANSTLPSPVALEDITYEYTPGFFGSGEGYIPYLNFQDPLALVNYYVVQLSLNEKNYDGLSDFILQDDRLSDGNFVSRPLFSDPLYQLGDTVGMELRSIDEFTYDYITEAQTIADGGSSAAPANPKSNWNNGALGYFSAYSKSNKSVIIE